MKIIKVDYQNNDKVHYACGCCETQDFSVKPVRDLKLTFENGKTFTYHMSASCDGYEISESDWMMILCNANTIKSIIHKIKLKSRKLLINNWIKKEVWYEYDGKRVDLTMRDGEKLYSYQGELDTLRGLCKKLEIDYEKVKEHVDDGHCVDNVIDFYRKHS